MGSALYTLPRWLLTWYAQGPLVAQWQGICLQCSRRRFNPWVRKIPWRRHSNHSSILAWRVLWTEKPGGLQSTGSERVGQDWATIPPLPHLWASAQSSSSWELVKLDFEDVVIWFQRLWALPASFPLHLVLREKAENKQVGQSELVWGGKENPHFVFSQWTQKRFKAGI